MKETKCGICPICGSSCGILVEVEDGAVVGISGDEKDPHSRGYVCPKGRSLKFHHEDPDRVLEPLRRTSGGWEKVSWDSAMDDIARRIADVQKKYGRDAVALYAGDGTTHSYETLLSIAAFITAMGIKNLFTANSMDSLPRQLASAMFYDSSGLLPVPDVKRTDFFLIIGSNPVVSNGSVMTAPGFARYLRDIRKRGGRVVVVDPRVNETAALADEHHFIRPESDALFLLAMMNVIFEEGLDSPGAVKKYLKNFDGLKKAARRFTPELAQGATGIASGEIRRIAREFASARSAVCYGRMGTCAQSFGASTSMLIDALNIITGNFDRPGGAMFTTPAVDMASIMKALGMSGHLGKQRTMVSGLPDFNGEMPCAALAEEIEAPNGIRALVVVGGNPAISVPDSRRLVAAFGHLDIMVSLDPHINATSCNAHYVLPPAIGIEHEIYPMMSYSVAIHNVAKWAAPVIPHPPTVRYDAEILGEIICRVAGYRAGMPELIGDGLLKLGKNIKGENILKALLAVGHHGKATSIAHPGGHSISLDKLKSAPHGIYLGPLEPRLEKLLGKKGKINLLPKILEDDLDRIAAHAEKAPDEDGTLVMISFRQLRFFNTSLHNISRLATGADQCALHMNPADAKSRGIHHGDDVIVKTEIGDAELPVALTDKIVAGVVAFPFGWNGRQPRARQSVIEKHPGANVNTVTDPMRIDVVSAMTAFNGTKVRVEKARVKGAKAKVKAVKK